MVTTSDELEGHFRALGWTVERLTGADNASYTVVRNYPIPAGSLAGRECDIAIGRVTSVPFVLPPVIHTRPALVPMDMGRYHTQQSPVGAEWQYWSRVLVGQPSPRAIVAHIATIFSEV